MFLVPDQRLWSLGVAIAAQEWEDTAADADAVEPLEDAEKAQLSSPTAERSEAEDDIDSDLDDEHVGPVTTWRAVAKAAGISMDTLFRRRKKWDITAQKPLFDDADAARNWYRKCSLGGKGLRPRSPAPRRAPRRPRPSASGTRGLTLADLRSRKG